MEKLDQKTKIRIAAYRRAARAKKQRAKQEGTAPTPPPKEKGTGCAARLGCVAWVVLVILVIGLSILLTPSSSHTTTTSSNSKPSFEIIQNTWGCSNRNTFKELGKHENDDYLNWKDELAKQLRTKECTLFFVGNRVYLNDIKENDAQIRRTGMHILYWVKAEKISSEFQSTPVP